MRSISLRPAVIFESAVPMFLRRVVYPMFPSPSGAIIRYVRLCTPSSCITRFKTGCPWLLWMRGSSRFMRKSMASLEIWLKMWFWIAGTTEPIGWLTWHLDFPPRYGIRRKRWLSGAQSPSARDWSMPLSKVSMSSLSRIPRKLACWVTDHSMLSKGLSWMAWTLWGIFLARGRCSCLKLWSLPVLWKKRLPILCRSSKPAKRSLVNRRSRAPSSWPL